MAYTKNHDPWGDDDILTTGIMDNFETIYTEVNAYLVAHNHDDLYPTKSELNATYWYAGNVGSGTGSDADKLMDGTTPREAAYFLNAGIPPGLIIMWAGSIVSIPSGWQLCDGTNSTQDLRDRFVYGGGTIAVGGTGDGKHTPTGTMTIATHELTAAEVKGHQHLYSDKYAPHVNAPNAGSYPTGGTTSVYGGLGTHTGQYTGYTGEASPTAHGHTTEEGTAFTGTEFTATPPYYALAYIQKL